MRVFICDDEPLAVRRLVSILSRVKDVEVVGSATSGREAIEMIDRTQPDLLLLDIEMPDIDGFDVVEAVARREVAATPLVAFVTAYRRYAPQAFDTGAVDFLSKPIRLARLETALDKARESIAGKEAQSRLRQLEKHLEDLRADRQPGDCEHIWIARHGEVIRIDLARIERVDAEGPYVRLYVDGATYLHRATMASIQERLDETRFTRVHRSHLLRIDQIGSIRRTVHGGSELCLVNGEIVPLGRKYATQARSRLLGAA